jgi:hypothetical protein
VSARVHASGVAMPHLAATRFTLVLCWQWSYSCAIATALHRTPAAAPGSASYRMLQPAAQSTEWASDHTLGGGGGGGGDGSGGGDAGAPPNTEVAMPPSTVWSSPTQEPGTSEFYGHATAQGAMPIGNGDTTALVWPDFEAGAVHIQVAKQDAMGNDMALMKIGSVSLIAGLPLRPEYFKQTLHLANATVKIEAGDTEAEATTVTVWVDASSNCVRARVKRRGTIGMSRGDAGHGTAAAASPMVVELSSVREMKTGTAAWDTGGGLNNCTYCTGTTYWQPPDTFDDPPDAPPTTPLLLSHSNPRNFSIVEAVLTQQGLGDLLRQPRIRALEQWTGRTFGLAVSGDGLDRLSARFLVSSSDASEHEVTVTTLSALHLPSQNGAWRNEVLQAHRRDRGVAYASAWTAHESWWRSFWDRSSVQITPGINNTSQTAVDEATMLTRQYANARYLQIIQSRGQWPIKFNGQLFVNHLPPFADFREWGSDEWWQNTRLPYGNMLSAGDIDGFDVILEFYLRMLPFSVARTQSYFDHPGAFWTETKTLFGAYSPRGWGCPNPGEPGYQSNYSQINFSNFHCYRPAHYPQGYEMSNSTHLDFHGGGQVAMMVLDHYLYTGNSTALQRYLPIASAAVEFFYWHYPQRTSTPDGGMFQVFPAQALEAYWCPLPVRSGECSTDDAPTLAALHAVLPRLLELPDTLTSAEQRTLWTTFLDILPPLPTKICSLRTNTTGDNQVACDEANAGKMVLSPCRVCSNITNLQETPELYSVHPFQVITAGRAHAAARASRGAGRVEAVTTSRVTPSPKETELQLVMAVRSYKAAPLAHYDADNPWISNIGWQQVRIDRHISNTSTSRNIHTCRCCPGRGSNLS